MIPYSTVASEADNGAFGFGAFGANGCGKPPAEGSGAADEHLIGVFEVHHGAGPYPGMTRVRDEDGVLGQEVGEFFAKAFGTHGVVV